MVRADNEKWVQIFMATPYRVYWKRALSWVMNYWPAAESAGWLDYLAIAVDWYYDKFQRALRCKTCSRLGGHPADYIIAELYCRSGQWQKGYTVVASAILCVIEDSTPPHAMGKSRPPCIL